MLTQLTIGTMLLVGNTGEIEATQPYVYHCETKPFYTQQRGGGLITNGWDGEGQNPTTLYFHIENYSPDITVAQQRTAVLDALSAWAGVTQIHFIEIANPNRTRSIDMRFTRMDHCVIESDECGDPDCPFDGPGGVLAHAAFPPGGLSTCGPASSEHRAGDVHFDEDETWEQDDFFGFAMSLTLITAHEVGHSLGLVHDEALEGGPHIMRPSFNLNDGMQAPSASDTSHLRSGYAAGMGSITMFEDTGFWVNSTWQGFPSGTPGEPLTSVEDAVDAIPYSSFFELNPPTVHVQAGLYSESLTISRPCVIQAENGTAIIGQ